MRFVYSVTRWSAATPDARVADTEFSLYIVRCADGTLYTGITTDVNRRLVEHESGLRGAKFLRGKGPLEVVFSEIVGDRAAASQLEYRVKKLDRSGKLELIDGRSCLDDLRSGQVLEEGCA